MLAFDVSDVSHFFIIASHDASLPLATELRTTVAQLATAVNSEQRTNTRVHFIKLRELTESIAALEQKVVGLESQVLQLAIKTAEAEVAQRVAEGYASRERVIQNLAHVARLTTLYSCARRAGLSAVALTEEALEYERVLDAEAGNNGKLLIEALFDPVFRETVRARADAEQL